MWYKILLAMRTVTAQWKFENVGIGAMMEDMVEKKLIAPLENALAAETDEDKKRKIAHRIQEWRVVAPAEKWNRIAYHQAISMVRANRKSEEEVDDVLQFAATMMWKQLNDPSSGGIMKYFNPLDLDSAKATPTGMVKLFSTTVKSRALDYFEAQKSEQPFKTKSLDAPFKTQDSDEGGTAMDDLQSKGDWMADAINSEFAKHLIKGLWAFIDRKAGTNPLYLDMFEIWLDVVKNKGIDYKMEPDVYAELQKRPEYAKLSIPTLHRAWKKLEEWKQQFLKSRSQLSLSAKVASRLKLSTVDAIIMEQMHQRMAKWILGSVYEKCMKESFVSPEGAVEKIRMDREKRK